MKHYTSYNFYFLIPFVVWVIIGGALLYRYDQMQLFANVNTRHNDLLDVIMYNISHLGEGQYVAVLLFLLLLVPGLRNWWYVVAAVSCVGFSALLVQMIKRFVSYGRPLSVYGEDSWFHIEPNWQHLYEYSFPSGHSAGAFSLFFFISCLLPRRFRVFGAVFFMVALLVAYSRLYLGAHFFLDVYVGSIIGTLFCLFFFFIMHRLEPAFFHEEWRRHKDRIVRK